MTVHQHACCKEATKTPSPPSPKPKQEYSKVWESFGKYLKVGILDDASNQDALAKLLR